ncbi:MAG TPA: PHB depolymerase family esterase [Polyangiaceae bacterium]|nr:PHB depolymerase family esterase [Polyangiaceae bacterium]
MIPEVDNSKSPKAPKTTPLSFLLTASALVGIAGCAASDGGTQAAGGYGASAGFGASAGSAGRSAAGGTTAGGASGFGTAGNGTPASGGTGATGGKGGAGAIGGSTANGGNAGLAGAASGGRAGAGGSNAGGGAGAGASGAGGNAGGTCSPIRSHAAGTTTVKMKFGGADRDYVLHIPPGYDGSKKLPLVFDVHGLGSFGTEQVMRSKWDVLSDKEGFVLIAPNGVGNSWNAGNCCGSTADDVGFFREMVKKASTELCIDTKRVYMSGHSNGGSLAYRLACEAADLFAAVNPVCGWRGLSSCKPSRPIAILEIRSLEDGTVQYNGGGIATSAASDLKAWLDFDRCAATPVQSSANGVCTTHTACAAGTQVMECHPHGNHDFFYSSNNTDKLMVPDTAWSFFKQFSLP